MIRNQSKWLDDEPEKNRDADNSGADSTYFGYQLVSQQHKARRVLKHFNKVAKRYDFMNSLLSFGIHHMWKRTAVGMLALKEGYRILDLCAGTGDLAILAGRRVGVPG